MCHVQAEICRGGGPNYVTEGGCHQVKTLIQKALNAGSTLSTGECEAAGTCPGLYCPYAFYFLTDRQTAYIDSSCGAQLRPIMGFLDVIPASQPLTKHFKIIFISSFITIYFYLLPRKPSLASYLIWSSLIDLKEKQYF